MIQNGIGKRRKIKTNDERRKDLEAGNVRDIRSVVVTIISSPARGFRVSE